MALEEVCAPQCMAEKIAVLILSTPVGLPLVLYVLLKYLITLKYFVQSVRTNGQSHKTLHASQV